MQVELASGKDQNTFKGPNTQVQAKFPLSKQIVSQLLDKYVWLTQILLDPTKEGRSRRGPAPRDGIDLLEFYTIYTSPGWDLYCSPCRLYEPTYRSFPHIPLEEVMWQPGEEVIQIIS